MAENLIPAHGSEELPWVSSARRPEVTSYTASIPPSIASLAFDLDREVAELGREVAVRIATLERQFAPQVKTLEPFLVRIEAIASSQIEEELTTVDQLARAEAGIPAPRTARTVKGAIDALERLVDGAVAGIELDAILAAHVPLMAADHDERWYAGRLRRVQNWIGGSNRSPSGAVHVPPAPERVAQLVGDLVDFMRRQDLDPVLQAAWAHVQFESIHPFHDGNGRIGRALINAIWRYRGVTSTLAVPVASAIAVERDRYFALVNDYRAGRLEPFVVFLAEAALLAIEEAEISAARLLSLPERWRAEVRPRSDSAAAALLDTLPASPIVDVDDVRRLTGASTPRAYATVSRLEEAGVLRPITQSRRNMTWVAADVVDEADSMLERLRLRGR